VTSQWLFCRLYAPGGATSIVPPAVARTARYVAAADPEGCFLFDRADDPAGFSVEVWADATPRVLAEAADRLRAEPLPPGWSSSFTHGVARPVRNPHESERDVADELAAVSSELALAVLAHGAPADDLGLALAHLRGVAGLVPPADRGTLLFHCWQHFSAALTPDVRVGLAFEASLHAGRGADAPDEIFRRYLDRTQEVVAAQRPGCDLPGHYLLFSQVTRTQDRLGVAPACSAVAALTVRHEFAEQARRQPVSSGRPA